jgi:hypothetical protein
MDKKTKRQIKGGPIRESNPGPPAPKAGIMPLDQSDSYCLLQLHEILYNTYFTL